MDDNCSLKLGRSEGRVVERTITPLAPLRLLLLLLVLTGMVVCMVDDPSEAASKQKELFFSAVTAVTATILVDWDVVLVVVR